MKTLKQIYQESYDEIRPARELVEDMLEDARTERRKWIQYAVLRPVAVVMLGVIVLFGGTSVIAQNVGFVYGIIERTSPELADLFVPVQETSTKAGIRMEVEAVYLEDKSAQVLISFQDTQEDRIQGPVELYDRYYLSSLSSLDASWVTGGCSYVGYDQETGKAYYRIQLSSDVAYERSKLTFGVRELLLHHEEEERDSFDGYFRRDAHKVCEFDRPECHGLGELCAAVRPDHGGTYGLYRRLVPYVR